ncbi:trihelix transcription factor GT-3a-like [Nematolebias whitei]|uniref:trihelix transcription factor GT-3a-like n=1 Tax=Nematolebias whitei TaxID=451745 RepID=UPI00189A4C91|nr:trihelix transcription factor GT-3a-like [Nematolebias whitei]
MARGQTWSEEEIKALIQVWSDENISQLLVTTHKNNEVYRLISLKMEELGFQRTAEQCRNKVKKLRQQYIKIRDMLRKSGSSADMKDKFPWYDELDVVLGTQHTSSPQHVLESYQAETPPPSTLAPSDSESTEQGQDSEKSDKSATDFEVEQAAPTSSLLDEERGLPRLAVPGAQKRKKKTKADRFENLCESYMDDQRKRDEDECKRMKQESASFESFLKMQQQAEEKHFQLMQEQQKANSQMFFQMMSTFLHAAMPQSVTPPTTQQWMPPTQVRPTASSHHQHNTPTHHTAPAPAQTPQEQYMAATSQHSASVIGDVNNDIFDL